MTRKADEAELKESLDRMRETALARLEMKKPSLGKFLTTAQTSGHDQEDGFTIRKLWDRFFSSGE